jgi:FAD/FMN-containing dehydrogenase
MATQHAYTAVHPGVAGRDGGLIKLTARQLDDLDSRIEGSLLCAGDDGWDEAVHVWNAMVARTPALVVRPACAEDVAATVVFAREHALLLSVKGGGHNIAGTAIADGGLTLDMSRMRDVVVEPQARLVNVGPGCLLGDVDGETQKHGLATVLGFVSETGVAGLTLGGGFGYLARRFGWAADNVEEVQIVTADGRIRIANRHEEPDLHWAVRGGGGNFGIVTRFTFRVHDVGPMVTGGLMLWSAERADEVFAAYRDLAESAPRELTLAAAVLTAPPAPFVPPAWHGKQAVGIICCHTGPNANADLEPVRALGDPIVDLVAERPYVEQQSMFNDLDPSGLHQYWKTEYLSELSTEYLDVFRDVALEATSPLSYSVIFHIGGALNERTDDDGAVGNRDARFITGFSGVWLPEDTRGDEHIAWVRGAWEQIRPFSTGGNYVNFQLAEDGAGRTEAAYGVNYARLRQVKAVYDPENLFRVNRNIPPAA